MANELELGENSINTAAPYRNPDGTRWLLDWYLRDWEGRLTRKRSQGATKTQVRRRAEAKAAELLAGSRGGWKASDALTRYIDEVTKPAIEGAPADKLRQRSKDRYLVVLRWLRAEFEGMSIAAGTRFRAQETALKNISGAHGAETARQARGVLSRYVNQQLIRDELIAGNPLAGMSIDLGSVKKKQKPTGGVALTRGEYDTVVAALLALDPSEGVKKGRGRYTVAQRVAKRRNAADLLLLGSATGLRIGEALSLDWAQVAISDGGEVAVTVTDQKSKTRRGRTVPVLDSRVAARIIERRPDSGTGFVIGSPTDSAKPWDRDNAQKAAVALLREIGAEAGVAKLASAGTHIWRATLNTLLAGEIPDATRAAFFGHDVEVNRKHYTDTTDVSGMTAAFRRRDTDETGEPVPAA